MPRDVPSPIDLQSLSDARTWAIQAMDKRPYRREFFRLMADILSALPQPPLILELGSGPGFLADYLLQELPYLNYMALDNSAAMHAIAIDLHPTLDGKMEFVTADFKQPNWNSAFNEIDAIISLQAIHEIRHKHHAPNLFRQIRDSLRRGGQFLYCDHFFGEGGLQNENLYMTEPEKEAALIDAGFTKVSKAHEQGTLSLWLALR